MADKKKQTPSDPSGDGIAHGALNLPLVKVENYNLELRSGGGFLGDKANKTAFWDFFNTLRDQLREADVDPLGHLPRKKVSKKTLEDLLADGDGEQAGVVMGAIEGFARNWRA